MNNQLLINNIANDEIQIMKEFEDIQNANSNDKDFLNKVYVLMCKTGFLKTVIEEAKHRGVSFNNHPIGFLDDIIDSLGEIADLKNMNVLNKDEEHSINEFALKYKDIISEEDLEDLLDLD